MESNNLKQCNFLEKDKVVNLKITFCLENEMGKIPSTFHNQFSKDIFLKIGKNNNDINYTVSQLLGRFIEEAYQQMLDSDIISFHQNSSHTFLGFENAQGNTNSCTPP